MIVLKTILCLTVVIASLGGSGCAGHAIVVITRPCVLSGAATAGSTNAITNPSGTPLYADDVDSAVFAWFNELNKDVWSQAQIGFLACCQSVPVIPSPDFTNGPRGTITLTTTLGSPAPAAYVACRAAWDQRGFVGGRVVIIVKDLVGSNGQPVENEGVTWPHPVHPTMCVEPRNLTVDDVRLIYSVVVEEAAYGYGFNKRAPTGTPHDTFIRVLAHELGHSLLLAHGDGLDNDQNGALPPTPGPRLFDTDCDPLEKDAEKSLMTQGSFIRTLTALQIELAREAAILVPGSAGGPP